MIKDSQCVGVSISIREGTGKDVVACVDDMMESFYFVGQSPRNSQSRVMQSHHPSRGTILAEIEHYTLAAIWICDDLSQMILLGVQS